MARWSAKPQLGFQPGHMVQGSLRRALECVCVCVCVCWGWGQQNVFHGFQGGTHMTQIAGSLSETLLLGQGEYTSETCRPMPEVQPMVSL